MLNLNCNRKLSVASYICLFNFLCSSSVLIHVSVYTFCCIETNVVNYGNKHKLFCLLHYEV